MIYYDYVWTGEDLEDWYREFDNWRGRQMPYDEGSGDREYLDITGHYPDPEKLIEAYINNTPRRVSDQFVRRIQGGFSVDARLSLYNPGQQYEWHSDDGVRHPEDSSWERILSSITYLNEGYEGGETEFLDQTIKPELGKTVIFPSSFAFPHRGKPVTMGVKHIMVLHIWV